MNHQIHEIQDSNFQISSIFTQIQMIKYRLTIDQSLEFDRGTRHKLRDPEVNFQLFLNK